MEYLKALKTWTDEACEAAYAERGSISGAVNWGDLSCVKAESYLDDSENAGYRVYIEEASPDATDFAEFVRNWLATRDVPGVEVITEW